MRNRRAPIKVCEHCDEPFVPKDPYAPRPARFCSLACYHASGAARGRTGNRLKIGPDELWVEWSGRRTRAVERTCESCGKTFLTIPAQVRQGRGRFCSRSCARQSSRRFKEVATSPISDAS